MNQRATTVGHATTAPSFALVILATCMAFVVGQLDVTIVNVALPSIARDLGAGVASLQWVVDAYAISFAACMLSAGAAGILVMVALAASRLAGVRRILSSRVDKLKARPRFLASPASEASAADRG